MSTTSAPLRGQNGEERRADDDADGVAGDNQSG